MKHDSKLHWHMNLHESVIITHALIITPGYHLAVQNSTISEIWKGTHRAQQTQSNAMSPLLAFIRNNNFHETHFKSSLDLY